MRERYLLRLAGAIGLFKHRLLPRFKLLYWLKSTEGAGYGVTDRQNHIVVLVALPVECGDPETQTDVARISKP